MATMDETGVQILDPETEFLLSKQKTGNEWELFKENVRPLKRGRNVRLLNDALRSHADNQLRKNLIEKRRRLIEAIDQYEGDDPLKPWLECIKWVQEAFPPGGDCSGLVVIYEQCVRKFWHSEKYREDLRYLKVWLEYAEHCADAEIIYGFLDANDIGKTHAAYYVPYALHLESKSKVKAANEIFNLGISRNAEPVEKLKDAYKKFLVRSMRSPKTTDDEESKENDLQTRSFGTLLSRGETNAGRQDNGGSKITGKTLKPNGTSRTPLSIYNDNKADVMLGRQLNKSKPDFGSWNTLGGRAERNKENNAVPGKWTSYKVPMRPFTRTATTAPAASFEVFVDEECAEEENKSENDSKPSNLPLQQVDRRDIEKETELLRQNPLRNFPTNSLPR